MVKPKEEVISEFNSLVNMTASDLETWLKSDDANSAGWPKDDADGDGETVGHDSGRKIVEILKANPDRKEDKYTDEQVEHMRKVVAYWYVPPLFLFSFLKEKMRLLMAVAASGIWRRRPRAMRRRRMRRSRRPSRMLR